MMKRRKLSKDSSSKHNRKAREGNNNELLEAVITEIKGLHDDIRLLNAHEKKEICAVKKKNLKLCQPLYEWRTDLVYQVPLLWLSVLVDHPRISTSLTRDDEQALQHLRNLEVIYSDDDENGYKIIFHFSRNKFFYNEVLTKEVYIDGDGVRKYRMTEIEWYPGKCLSSKSVKSKPQTFFSWLCETSISCEDSLDNLIRDELWPNPLLSNHRAFGWNRKSASCISAHDRLLQANATNNNAVCFLMARNIFCRTGPPCPVCQRLMPMKMVSESLDGVAFRCHTHKKKASVRRGTFLKSSYLKAAQFICFVYCWAFRLSLRETGRKLKTGLNANYYWLARIREVCVWYLNMYPRVIGGTGCVVELDLRPLSTKKSQSGETLTKKWILIGVDQISELGFLATVSDRSRQTLGPLIQQYIAPGSIVHTDKRGPFDMLKRMPMKPALVWKIIKLPKKSVRLPILDKMWKRWLFQCEMYRSLKSSFKNDLYEFMWRQEFGRTEEEAFDNILQHISTWYPTT